MAGQAGEAAPVTRSAAGRRSPRTGVVLVLLIVPVAMALVSGTAAGLARLGVALPLTAQFISMNHGALMVGGFIGTVIGVERATAHGRWLAFAAPVLSACGAVSLALAPSTTAGALLLTASAFALLALFAAYLRRQFALPLLVMAAGVACWCAGNVVWLIDGWAPRTVVPWWIAFLVLTITGERLELTRFLPLHALTRLQLWFAVALTAAGPAIATAGLVGAGARVLGIGIGLAAIWLMQHDSARRTYRRGGTASYAGSALLIAYGWLGVTGAGLILDGMAFGTFYDPTLHAFFLGFVFGAVFAHAPIIIPAVSGLGFRFTAPLFVLGLAVLHLSVAVRVGAGVTELLAARQVAGALHVVAILLLVSAILAGLLRGRAGAARQ